MYYGTEQGFDSGGRSNPEDRVLRENMFGGRFGAKRTSGVHFFDEEAILFKAVATLNKLRRDYIALRRGRQYMHDISGDGVHFGPPTKFGDRLLSPVTWSRVMGDQEVLLAFNTDERETREIYTALNPHLRTEGDELRLIFSYTPKDGLINPEQPKYAFQTIKVQRCNGVICARLRVGPAGFVAYLAKNVFGFGSEEHH
jgi:hypothetical protein